eukprot:767174-Hanusia_phi.AAC.8
MASSPRNVRRSTQDHFDVSVWLKRSIRCCKELKEATQLSGDSFAHLLDLSALPPLSLIPHHLHRYPARSCMPCRPSSTRDCGTSTCDNISSNAATSCRKSALLLLQHATHAAPRVLARPYRRRIVRKSEEMPQLLRSSERASSLALLSHLPERLRSVLRKQGPSFLDQARLQLNKPLLRSFQDSSLEVAHDLSGDSANLRSFLTPLCLPGEHWQRKFEGRTPGSQLVLDARQLGVVEETQVVVGCEHELADGRSRLLSAACHTRHTRAATSRCTRRLHPAAAIPLPLDSPRRG